MKKKIAFRISLFFMICSLVPAFFCGASEDKDILTVIFPKSKIEFNPYHTYSSAEAQIFTALYEGLVNYNPFTLEPVPAAASEWDISSDKRIYTFTLRKNAGYWDGTAVTAKDFRNAWLRMIDPEEDANYAFLFDIIEGVRDYRSGKLKDSDKVGIKAVDNYTLRIILEKPADFFLKILCHHSFTAVHPSFLKLRDWSGLASVPGNGPYYILDKDDDHIHLVKNKLYWDEANVHIPEINILFIDSAEESTLLFNEKKTDWVTGNFISSFVRSTSSIVFNPLFASSYFYFNCRKAPFDDSSIRYAFSLMLPWEEIRDKKYILFPAPSIVLPVADYPEIEGMKKTDRELALHILESKGYGSEKRPLKIIIKIPEKSSDDRIYKMIEDAWEKIPGVAVDIQEVDYDIYYDSLKNNDYTLAEISWIGDFPDPLTFLQMWTSESNINDSGFHDSGFDVMIEKSFSLSGSERYAALAEAEQMLFDKGVVLPLSYSFALNLIRVEKIDGWYANPLDIHPFKYLRFRKEKLPAGLV